MTLLITLITLSFVATAQSGGLRQDEKKIIDYAKAIEVVRLDPTLPTKPLEEWLRKGPAGVEKLKWSVSDCDLKPDHVEPAEGYPLCVKVRFQRGHVAGWAIVTVGTIARGIVEPPRFDYATVSARSAAGMRVETADRLSQLPHLIASLAETR